MFNKKQIFFYKRQIYPRDLFLGKSIWANKLYSYLRKKYKEKEYFNFNGILFPDFHHFNIKMISWFRG